MNKTQYLYRHFDCDGQLLYVGISKDPAKRTGEHSSTAHWFDKISQITVEKFETRKQVIEAEKKAIQNENPLFNIVRPKEQKELTKKELKHLSFLEAKESLRRKVLFKVSYTIKEVAEELKIPAVKVKELIETNLIGSFCIGERVYGNSEKPTKEYRISGWHLIDYIENMEFDNNAP